MGRRMDVHAEREMEDIADYQEPIITVLIGWNGLGALLKQAEKISLQRDKAGFYGPNKEQVYIEFMPHP